MKNQHLGLKIIIMLLCVGMLAGCMKPAASNPANRPTAYLFVGVPVTDFQANAGQAVLGGVQLAAAEYNLGGGVNGYNVEVIPLDDQSDSDLAVENVAVIQSYLDRGEKVLGIVGHLNSGQTLATMPYYQQMGLLTITPTSSEISITSSGWNNIIRVNAKDDTQAQVLGTFIADSLQCKTVAIVFNETEYGRGLAGLARISLELLNIAVPEYIQVLEGQDQYASEVQRLLAATPDAVLYIGYEIETPYLVEALRNAGYTGKFIASDGAFLSPTIDEAGGMAEGMYVTGFAPDPGMAATDTWISAYQNVVRRNPDTYSINGYISAKILFDAINSAKSFELSKVRQAFNQQAFDTQLPLVGKLSFDGNGDVSPQKIWVYQVVNGEFVMVQ